MSKFGESGSKGFKITYMANGKHRGNKGQGGSDKGWVNKLDMYSRPLVAGEPAGPSMVSEVPGPVSQQLHSELSSIQAMDSVHFFADYDKY